MSEEKLTIIDKLVAGTRLDVQKNIVGCAGMVVGMLAVIVVYGWFLQPIHAGGTEGKAMCATVGFFDMFIFILAVLHLRNPPQSKDKKVGGYWMPLAIVSFVDFIVTCAILINPSLVSSSFIIACKGIAGSFYSSMIGMAYLTYIKSKPPAKEL